MAAAAWPSRAGVAGDAESAWMTREGVRATAGAGLRDGAALGAGAPRPRGVTMPPGDALIAGAGGRRPRVRNLTVSPSSLLPSSRLRSPSSPLLLPSQAAAAAAAAAVVAVRAFLTGLPARVAMLPPDRELTPACMLETRPSSRSCRSLGVQSVVKPL